VKNNLQVITSLLSLQSREIEDPVALDAVKSSQNRVRSMAMIHQNLYKEDSLNSVNASGYLKNICDSVLKSYKVGEKDITLSVECDEVELDIDTTIPLGLILNELITNALKYAFVEQESGIISVSLKSHENDLILKVKDNGIGIEEDHYKKGTSIGLKLIEAFAKKLKATWKVIKNNGTEITFRFNQTT
ncbi:MAG: sensor histidine kinase, partial [Bacteroidota bacterium]